MICNPPKLQRNHCELLSRKYYTYRAFWHEMASVEEEILQKFITLLLLDTRDAIIHNDENISIFYVVLLEKIDLIINPI